MISVTTLQQLPRRRATPPAEPRPPSAAEEVAPSPSPRPAKYPFFKAALLAAFTFVVYLGESGPIVVDEPPKAASAVKNIAAPANAVTEVASTETAQDVSNVLQSRTQTASGATCPTARGEVDLSKRLEFLHITKTGGSTLEVLAAKHDVPWACCHFLSAANGMTQGTFCPGGKPQACKMERLPDGTKVKADPSCGKARPRSSTKKLPAEVTVWHAPPKYLEEDEKWWLRNSTWFTVVRDPYERIVSSWNFHCNEFGLRTDCQRDATAMNAWVRERMEKVYNGRPTAAHGTDWKPGYFGVGTLVPQTEHIDENVKYVLHMETLQRDFLCMARAHGLDWEWDETRWNRSKPGHLTGADLTSENMRFVEKVYQRDFEELGYPYRKTN